MKFKVIFEPEPEGGYTVICPDVKGAVSYGETVEEALEMIKDAIEGILEVRGELEKYAPPP
ncbi:type II toxin-antitoxin system HicB family antitoxin [Candidatus Pyrohabitans sp.]